MTLTGQLDSFFLLNNFIQFQTIEKSFKNILYPIRFQFPKVGVLNLDFKGLLQLKLKLS